MDNHLLRYNKQIKYSLIDCETFNLSLSFHFNRPWQVSVLNFQGNQVTSEKDCKITWNKVAPNLKIGAEAARITHFNEAIHNQVAIQPQEAFEMFWQDLKDSDYIMGHNILRFDMYLLKGYAEFMGVDWKWIVPKIIDTKAIAQGWKMGVPYSPKQGNFIDYQYRYANTHVRGIKTSLSVLAREFGIEVDESQLHNSAYDLLINKAVWDKLKFQIEL